MNCTMNCTICGQPAAENEIWAYAHRKGGEVSYPVCAKCASHQKHAAAIVDGVNRKLDAAGGYR